MQPVICLHPPEKHSSKQIWDHGGETDPLTQFGKHSEFCSLFPLIVKSVKYGVTELTWQLREWHHWFLQLFAPIRNIATIPCSSLLWIRSCVADPKALRQQSLSVVLSVLPLILSTGNIKGTLGLKDILCPLKHTSLFYPPSPLTVHNILALSPTDCLHSNEGSCFSHPTHLLFPCLSSLLSAPTVAVEITHFTDPTPPGQLVPTAVVQKAIKIKHSSAMNHKPEQISEVI